MLEARKPAAVLLRGNCLAEQRVGANMGQALA